MSMAMTAPSLPPRGQYRGRFAPSPTGDLHVGSAACALLAWLAARTARGTFVLRVEDLDTPRVRAGYEAQQLADLRWLGLDWDEGPDVGGPFGPYRQSQRKERYEEALSCLDRLGLTYPCDCSRADIGRIASAPHLGEEGPLYPGTCRNAPAHRVNKRPPSVRIRIPASAVISFRDRLQGAVTEELASTSGDFVLRRADGIHAYQLAVVVDDLAMEISEVVRGADLLASTARQIWLAQALGGVVPCYAHVPLVVGVDGQRLAKRAHGVALRHYREAGIPAEVVVGALAHTLGLTAGQTTAHPVKASDLVGAANLDGLVGLPMVRVPSGLARIL